MNRLPGGAVGGATGAVLGAGVSLATSYYNRADPETIAVPALASAAAGCFTGFIYGSSPDHGAANVAGAVWALAKSFVSSKFGLDSLLSMQSAVVSAIAGYITVMRGGVAPTSAQMAMIKMGVSGIAFDAAARPAGLLVGGVQALASAIETIFDKCGLPIRGPNSPLMATVGPDMGGLCFLSLGAKAALSTQYFYEHGAPPPVTPITALRDSWNSAAAGAAGAGAAIFTTTVIHRETRFGPVKPLGALDVMISASNALSDAGPGPQIVFPLAAFLNRDGPLGDALPPEVLMLLRAVSFGPGITYLAHRYLVQRSQDDRPNGAHVPISALRQAGPRESMNPVLAVPVRTLEARLAGRLEDRLEPQDQIGCTRHLLQVTVIAYKVLLTTLCVAVASRAGMRGDGPFEVEQTDLDRMVSQEAGLQAVAATLAFIVEVAGPLVLMQITKRWDPDARRAFEGWVAMLIAAIDTVVSACSGGTIPGFAHVLPLSTASGAIVNEVLLRYLGSDKHEPAYPEPDAALGQCAAEIPPGTKEPGVLERFKSYFRLACLGYPPPGAAPVALAEMVAVQVPASPLSRDGLLPLPDDDSKHNRIQDEQIQ